MESPIEEKLSRQRGGFYFLIDSNSKLQNKLLVREQQFLYCDMNTKKFQIIMQIDRRISVLLATYKKSKAQKLRIIVISLIEKRLSKEIGTRVKMRTITY